MYQDDLYHYGVKGMRWGIIRSRYNRSHRKRKSLDKPTSKTHTENKPEDNEQHKRPFDKQKKAVTAIATYGTYRLAKSGKLDKYVDKGKARVNKLFVNTDFGKQKIISILGSNNSKQSETQTVGGFKRLAKLEPLEETIKRVNPNASNPDYKNNCSACAVGTFLRTKGFDVTAKGTGGKQQNLGGVIEECFKGAKVIEGSAVKFGNSKQDAADMLVKRFGSNASGVVGIQWKGGGGHAFNWAIKDGIVSFFDGQKGVGDYRISNYWKIIDPNNALTLARLDNAEFNLDALKRYIE